MKYFLSILLCFVCVVNIYAQEDITKLKNVGTNENIIKGQAIIYGLFIQRLDTKSAGYPQYICIEDTKTYDRYIFEVKTASKPDKENIFCCHIPPATYRIVSYYWVISNWYGGTAHNEPVYKGITVDKNFNKRLDKGEIKEEDLQTYTFTIRPNTINYMGTWNFGVQPATFASDKEKLDINISKQYPGIDFSMATNKTPL
jgi:hypothetical protein